MTAPYVPGSIVREPSQNIDSLIAARRRALASDQGDTLGALIAARRQALAQTGEPAQPAVERPGVLSRAATMVGQGLKQMVTHPIDAAETLIVAPIQSAFTAAVAPGVGEARPDPRLSKGGNSSGRAIDTSPYDAEHGGVTRGQRTAAGIQSLVNVAAPGAFGPLASTAGKTAALSLTGAAASAAYNPDDPFAAALAGGFTAPLIGKTIEGGTKLASTGTRASRLTKRIAAATPVDEHALAQNKATEAATRANYGQAAAEGEAAGGTSPALQSALSHETVKPYVEMVRQSPRFKNADDATVAREAYKQISRQRRGLIKRSNGPNGYDAKADLEAGDLADAAQALKAATAAPSEVPRNPTTVEGISDFQRGAGQGAGRLLGTNALRPQAEAAMAREAAETPLQRAARQALEARTNPSQLDVVTPAPQRTTTQPGVMPSFPTAVSEHARMMGNSGVFEDAVDMTPRVMTGQRVKKNQLRTGQTRAAWLDRINQMTPEQAAFTRDAVLGSARPLIRPVVPSPGTVAAGMAGGAIFGGGPGAAIGALGGIAASAGNRATTNLARLGRIAPILDALDAAAGTPTRQPVDPTRALQAAALLQAFATRPDTSRNRRP